MVWGQEESDILRQDWVRFDVVPEVEIIPQLISTPLKANGSPAIQPDAEEKSGFLFKELLEVTLIWIVHVYLEKVICICIYNI